MDYHPTVKRCLAALPGIMARYYDCDFYLVGSAQTSLDPRDIDIVVNVPDELFLAMYNAKNETIETWATAVDSWTFKSEMWNLWARDISKQGKELTMLAGRQVDFKTHPSSYFWSIDKMKTLINSPLRK